MIQNYTNSYQQSKKHRVQQADKNEKIKIAIRL